MRTLSNLDLLKSSELKNFKIHNILQASSFAESLSEEAQMVYSKEDGYLWYRDATAHRKLLTAEDFSDDPLLSRHPEKGVTRGVLKEMLHQYEEGMTYLPPCDCGAVEHVPISSVGTTVHSVDGHTLVDGDRVLLTAQTDGRQNGIYLFQGGSLSRDPGMAAGSSVKRGSYTVVSGGVQSKGVGYIVTGEVGPVTVVGTDPMNWVRHYVTVSFYRGSDPVVVTDDVISLNMTSLASSLATGQGLKSYLGSLSVKPAQGSAIFVDENGVDVDARALAFKDGSEISVTFLLENDYVPPTMEVDGLQLVLDTPVRDGYDFSLSVSPRLGYVTMGVVSMETYLSPGGEMLLPSTVSPQAGTVISHFRVRPPFPLRVVCRGTLYYSGTAPDMDYAGGTSNYQHPTGDGNMHVPATGTSNGGKVLTAGPSAGVFSWKSVSWDDMSGKPTLFPPSAHTHAISSLSDVSMVEEPAEGDFLVRRSGSWSPSPFSEALGDVPWSKITDTPDTAEGYGITDVFTKTETALSVTTSLLRSGRVEVAPDRFLEWDQSAGRLTFNGILDVEFLQERGKPIPPDATIPQVYPQNAAVSQGDTYLVALAKLQGQIDYLKARIP